jgi:cytochrome c oxidase subunit 2
MKTMIVLGQSAGDKVWMPTSASTLAESHDPLFYFIYWVSVVSFVAVVGTAAWFAVKYRRRSEGQRTADIHGNTKLEILWATVPAIVLVVLFAWGFWGFMETAIPPAGTIDVRVTAKRWNWEFDYPQAGILGSDELVVPVGQPVKLTMSSVDVIHSFFVPDFRVKRDVVPNRYTVAWFEATKEGEYRVLCAEYCGTDHSRMSAPVRVVSRAEYDEWIASGGPLGKIEDPIELGAALFRMRGCAQCHSVDGTATGKAPTLGGAFGSTRTLSDGSQVLVDDNYVRESLMSPQARIVQGWENAYMPTFRGRFDEKQLNAMVDYLKSIGQ